MSDTMDGDIANTGRGGDDLRRVAARRDRPAPVASAARIAADRHTRRVRRLRILLPAAAIGVAVGIVAVAWIQSRLQGTLDVRSVLFSKDGLTMVEPHLSGHSAGRAYDINAQRAVQSIENPKLVSLEGVRGRIEMADGSWSTIEADRGLYDGTREHLTLDDKVSATTSTGWRADGTRADADLTTGRITSDKRVRISGKTGWIEADTLDAADGGHHMLFTGNVRMEVVPGGGSPAAAADTPPAASPAAPPAASNADAR